MGGRAATNLLVNGRIDSCITQLKAQGPSRTCNECKEEEEEEEEEEEDLLVNGLQLQVAAGVEAPKLQQKCAVVPRRARI